MNLLYSWWRYVVVERFGRRTPSPISLADIREREQAFHELNELERTIKRIKVEREALKEK